MTMEIETQEQIRLSAYLDRAYPNVLYTASAGGMRTSMGTAVKMKRMGYKKGTPDIMVFEPTEKYRGLFIELKRPKTPLSPKGDIKPHQTEWLEKLKLRGYMATVCYGFDEAKTVLDEYIFVGKVRP